MNWFNVLYYIIYIQVLDTMYYKTHCMRQSVFNAVWKVPSSGLVQGSQNQTLIPRRYAARVKLTKSQEDAEGGPFQFTQEEPRYIHGWSKGRE
jgi:hypothetical protein